MFKKVLAGGLGLAVILLSCLVTTGSSVAEAAPKLKVVVHNVSIKGCLYTYADLYLSDGRDAGFAEWSRDPCGGDPGDSLRAWDGLADGYGIYAYAGTGWIANTAGHDSPYYSPWATHNVAEGSQYNMEACREKGGKLYECSKIVTVTA